MEGEHLGFNLEYDSDNPDDLYPDAWCDQCEKILDAEGEWNDKSIAFADIKIVCCYCYENIRDKNWKQDDEIYHELIQSSFHYVESVQKSFLKKYKIGEHERWDWDQETGKLIFSHKGEPQVEAKIHFSGSYSTKSNTWMWAWANSSLEESIKASSRCVKELGYELGLKQLLVGCWTATEVDGWEMTYVLAKKLNAIGVYRNSMDGGFTYMVITSAKWVNKNKILKLFKR